MAIVFQETDGELIPAVEGKIIRIRRLVFSSDETGWIQFYHGYATISPVEITPKIYARAVGVNHVDLRFDGDMPQSARGKNIGCQVTLGISSYSVWVEYEVVD